MSNPSSNDKSATVGRSVGRFLTPALPPLEEVVSEYQHAYSSGLITNGATVERFEQTAAERLRVPYCIAVSSCTSGLMLVARALGLKGKVILPSFTFFATAHAMRWNGLDIAFSDCDPATWNIDPAEVERLMSDEISAIVGVHVYGNPCDTAALQDVAKRYSKKLIFDAAHAFGSFHEGRPVGVFGDAEVFSLSPTKILIAGEGGLVATHDSVLAQRVRAARNYGDAGAYDPQLLGLNARMTEFNAAIALRSLAMVDSKVRRRNEIAQMYESLLAGVPGISFQTVKSGDTSTYKDYSIHVDSRTFPVYRDELATALMDAGIETKKYFYPPLHRQRLYSGNYRPEESALHVTDFISEGVVSLPIYESLPDETALGIAAVVKQVSQAYVRTISVTA